MVRLPRPVMMTMSVIPAPTACSITYWMAGLSTRGSISLGCDFVAGRNLVPRPAAGMTAFLTFIVSLLEARSVSQGAEAQSFGPWRCLRAEGKVARVSEAVAQGRWRLRAGPGAVLVPGGIALTLIGVIGDLLGHTLNPSGHTQEALIVLGRGNNPWHLVLFAGIVVTTLGGVRWASRLSSEAGGLIGAALFLLLIATLVLGAYSGWKAADHTALAGSVHVVAAVPDQAGGTGAGTLSDAGAGQHATHQGAAATGEGAE